MCGPIFASLSFNGVVWTPSLETGMGICVTMDQCVQRRASSVLCDVIIRNRGTSDLLYVMLQYLLLDPESQVWNYTVGVPQHVQHDLYCTSFVVVVVVVVVVVASLYCC